MSARLDKEKARKNISLILDKVKTEADPVLLNQYRSLFKKNVSFFRRSWAAAWLLMLFDQGALGRFERNRGRREGRQEVKKGGADRSDSRDEGQRYPLAEEDSKRLFISVGRNRRVYPREILGLINSKTSIPKEDIGAIRILDNYSFVQVRDTVAQRIIDALNGFMFRGRTLTVNFAKSKTDEGEESMPNVDNDSETAEDFSEQDQDHSDKEDV
ncbi:RNA-binding protein [Spirochaetia bacterium]|nr:RNA-binding protein [Spirochaetia bacterium]